ncbi:MAG: MinD/ParA family protein [Nitrospinae bacterium]|nr:MinD/ParA family protein [Nitrospinota bacterium]
MDQAAGLRRFVKSGGAANTAPAIGLGRLRGLAVASGKGGVGKTNFVANLAYTLGVMGKRTLVFDADMGLGNVHILLGLAPRYNLQHVISGERTMEEALMRGPGGMAVLPAGSGHRKYSELNGEEMLTLKTELEALSSQFDYILFDIGAGISHNVMYFCSSAKEVAVITNTEPTAFADAYALMKVLSRDYDQRKFRLVVNSVAGRRDADIVHNRLEQVADRFNLNIQIDLMGYIMSDEMVLRSVREQRLFTEQFPSCKASECIRRIARTFVETSAPMEMGWDQLLALHA